MDIMLGKIPLTQGGKQRGYGPQCDVRLNLLSSVCLRNYSLGL